MKKASFSTVIAVLALLLTSCSQNDGTSGIELTAPSTSSFSAGETEETTLLNEQTAEETMETEETANSFVSRQSTSTLASGEEQQRYNQSNENFTNPKLPHVTVTPSPAPTELPNPTNSPAATPQPTNPPAVSTPQPVQTESPSPTAPPAATPQPTEPPKPKTAYDTPYDTAQIIEDARAYGESIGMIWSVSLTQDNCSWEAPIQTSSVLSGERLKETIESGIRRVKRLQEDNEYQPGEFHFKLYLESLGNGEYSLYFLMG